MPRTAIGRNPVTAPPDYTDQEREFIVAMDRYQRQYKRPYPTHSEALAVLLSLGYRLVAEPVPLPKYRG